MQNQNNISYIGKPFPLEEAEDRFRELKKAKTNSFKLTIPWAAIEHEGAGIYDEAYLAYLRKILIAADKEGISVFIEPSYDLQSVPAWAAKDENKDNCIAAFKHAQRRLKNCKAIAGWGDVN
jgi:beta-galactosidase GanA